MPRPPEQKNGEKKLNNGILIIKRIILLMTRINFPKQRKSISRGGGYNLESEVSPQHEEKRRLCLFLFSPSVVLFVSVQYEVRNHCHLICLITTYILYHIDFNPKQQLDQILHPLQLVQKRTGLSFALLFRTHKIAQLLVTTTVIILPPFLLSSGRFGVTLDVDSLRSPFTFIKFEAGASCRV